MRTGIIAASAAAVPPIESTYPLDDNGSNADQFGFNLLPTIAPARNRAVYTCTGSNSELVATPASLSDVPGSVVVDNNGFRVCGFKVNSASGASGQRLAFYMTNGAPTVDPWLLFYCAVEVAPGGVNCLVTFGSRTVFGTYPIVETYTGPVAGLKLAMQVARDYNVLKCKFFAAGNVVGETAWSTATPQRAVAAIYIADELGSGVIDAACVPTVAAGLTDGYGTFEATALDMADTLIP